MVYRFPKQLTQAAHYPAFTAPCLSRLGHNMSSTVKWWSHILESPAWRLMRLGNLYLQFSNTLKLDSWCATLLPLGKYSQLGNFVVGPVWYNMRVARISPSSRLKCLKSLTIPKISTFSWDMLITTVYYYLVNCQRNNCKPKLCNTARYNWNTSQ